MVARGRFELPSAGDSYPILAGIQSPLGTLAHLARNAHAMLDHYTTGLRKVPQASVFIRGFRARTGGSLYTCRKSYIMYAVPPFHFPCESLWWDRFHPVRWSDRGSGELESEPYDHANSSWEKSFESSRLSRVWRRESDRGLRSG